MLCECCATVYNTKSQLSNNKIIAILLCDPGAIQTHDLQNRNILDNLTEHCTYQFVTDL